ncbi:thioredoxin reductase (NADPH) [Desulfovibrionales bacterium]
MKLYECSVVGGGPAGMTAVLYLVRSGVKTAWIEKFSPGGQILMTESIENYPGFPKGIKGYELANLFESHVARYEVDRYNDSVSAIGHAPGVNRLRVGVEWIKARSVVLCSGVKYRKLGLPREKELTGKGVSYCALCDGNFFRGQVVGVVGGGNTALEEALYLANLVDKIYLIHRRDSFRGCQLYQEKVAVHPKIEILYNHAVKELLGSPDLVGIRLRDVCRDVDKVLNLAGLFIFIGSLPVTTFVPRELTLDKDGFIITDAEMRTNLPGIFAAGDCRFKRCRQVCTAVGDGATAANAVSLYLEQFHD